MADQEQEIDPRLLALLAQGGAAGKAPGMPMQPNGRPDLSGVGAFGNQGFGAGLEKFGPGLALEAAGLALGPAGKVMQGIGAAAKSAPTLSAALAGGGLAASTGSEAGNEVTPSNYKQQSLLQEVLAGLPDWLGGQHDDQRPLTREEYIAKRGRPVAKSKDEFMSSEMDKVRASDRYQEAGKSLRQNLENEARRSADALYKSYSESQGDAGRSLDSDYEKYKAGWATQRKEHLSKPFVERHPKTGLALTLAGPATSAVSTRAVFGKLNKMGDEIATAGATARKSDNMRDLADSIVKADKHAVYSPLTKGVTALEASLMPAEMRMTADFIDKKSLPPDAPAQQAAQTRMDDIPTYLKGMGYDVASGVAGTAGGALWAKARTPSPSVDLAALRNHAAGVERGGFPEMLRGQRMSQDELAAVLADRATNAVKAQDRLNAARQGVPSGPAGIGGGPSQTPVPGTPNQSAAPMEGELIPPRSSLAARVRSQTLPEPRNDDLARILAQDQLPSPAKPSSSDLVRTLAAPANRNVPKSAEVKRGTNKLGHDYVKDPDNGRFTTDPDK
jgi:hypothetical protein